MGRERESAGQGWMDMQIGRERERDREGWGAVTETEG